MSDSLVIIPTFNEIENVEAIIRKVLSLQTGFHVLVVDDNSPDGTAARVESLMPGFEGRLFLSVRMKKSGLGTAYIHGFRWAIARHYDFIFEMDADFSHNPDDLDKLRDTCAFAGADMAVGSRYLTGVNVVNWPLSRVLLSYFASTYVRLITGMTICDATAGFVCHRRKLLESLDFDRIRFIGYAFQIEMKYRAHVRKARIVEVPIIFTDRTRGQSKMSNAIIKEAVFGVIALRLRHLFNLL